MSEKDAGKTLGTDLVSGKQTFPLIALFETMDAPRADAFAKNLSSQNPEEIIKMMKSSGVEKICAEEMERRIGLAERALGKFPGTADKLLEFCAAMRELALG